MFTCYFCDKIYTTNSGKMLHQKQCNCNPDKVCFQKGRKAWNKGKTKLSDQRIQSMALNASITMMGRKPGNWNPNRENLRQYRTDCAFKFSVYDYAEEFDLLLIEQYGWYKAKNRGNNQNGVSRDHLISVKYGFENNLSPKMLAHPANCRLIRHSENVRKYSKNLISIEELQKRIFDWELKYGVPDGSASAFARRKTGFDSQAFHQEI